MKSAAQFWDGVSVKYAKQPISNIDAYTATLERTQSYLKADDRVLEVGCGTGTTALRLSDAVRDYVGSDISPGMIRIASEKAFAHGARNVDFKTASIGDLTAKDGPFDVVLAFNLLHLLPNLDEDTARIAALLRPGGLFISKTFCGLGAKAPLKFILLRLALPVMQFFGKAPFVQFQKEQELVGRIAAHGFDIVETQHFTDDVSAPYVVARKRA